MFKEIFTRLIRHLPSRLVHRDPLPGAQQTVNTAVPPSLSAHCLKMAVMPEEELWKTFDTHPEGLNQAEVESAREQHGENKLPAQQPSPWWVHLWVCYRNPFNILLTILGAISYATEDLFAAGVIALMVAISTLLNFIQEARSTKAADALKAMVSNTATVLRVINDKGENGWLEIPIDQLVPGDIIKLAAGDMIPADLRILQARDLFVAQASLTGESLPVEKAATTRQPEHSNPLECDTLCFMGTTVVSGTAQAMVIATGANTWFGQLAGRVSEQESEPNAFQQDQPRQYAADSLYAGDGSGGVAYQRLHQRRLVGSGTVCAFGRGRLNAGNVADDCYLDAGARRSKAVETESDRQTSGCYSELWRNGYSVH